MVLVLLVVKKWSDKRLVKVLSIDNQGLKLYLRKWKSGRVRMVQY